MFTGLIEQIGTISSIKKNDDGLAIGIYHSSNFDLKINDSIACHGVCLTVVNRSKNKFYVQLVNETLEKTNAKLWSVGDNINLERALLPSTRLGGHFVQGHIDGKATVTDIRYFDKSSFWSFKVEQNLAKYIVEKGSIALNGTSLTVASMDCLIFSVAIIPHTLKMTTFSEINIKDSVNLEVDILGKYIEKLLQDKK